MISSATAYSKEVTSFRTKLAITIMLVVSAVTVVGIYLGQGRITANAERDLRQKFQAELSGLDKLQELRNAALAERCRVLAEKPRIHAALEDNALELLYPSAKDELRDLLEGGGDSSDQAAGSLHARFCRFLDGNGAVLSPPSSKDLGALSANAEAQLALKQLPTTQQIGYVSEDVDLTDETVDEVIAVPIFSTESGEIISALVVGFKPFEIASKRAGVDVKSGIWAGRRLHMPSLSRAAQTILSNQMGNALSKPDRARNNFTVEVQGVPQLLFYKRLNPDSLFPPAYEICVYSLADSIAQQRRLRWQFGGVGALLLLGGFVTSHFVAVRFAKPVEQLALDSERNRAQRRQAEEKLMSTSEKLKRSTRYSADASHQLKSPLTVLRAGLEALLAHEDFKPEIYEELSTLLHQTRRLNGVIEDLLLLARLDAGHLQIQSEPVNLSQLVEEWLDDLDALPDSLDVEIQKEVPPDLYVAGAKRYVSLIVQNLLENSRKYNRKGGRIRVAARANGSEIRLTIGNTGQPIARDAQEHIFERFRRAATGATVSGHGLGLNLARELARLHDGDLKLVRSADDWTEFEARFPAAQLSSDGGS
jgi:signal transduction histidine kinase